MTGLSSTEAADRLAQFGPNALPERRPDPWTRRFARQFANALVYILLFALAFDVAFWIFEGAHGWPLESLAIALILLFNALLGMYQEHRSEAALSRLRALGAAHAWVLRDGHLTRLPAGALVPGDCVRVETGDRVPADGTLVGARGVMVDESLLTGESVPVDKDDSDPLFSGTLLLRGTAFLHVDRTGAGSAMGRLATMLASIQPAKTPLERRVDALAQDIARWVLTLAALLALLGIVAEGVARAPHMILFAVALAVAAVPEGLPAVLTVTLSLGVERMARHRAVVRKLSAVEALGSVTVIATDKTGTLTENRMEVRAVDAADMARAMRTIALVNDADLSSQAGDPLDLGLLRHAAAQGIDVAVERRQFTRVSERPFDSAWKFARVTVRDDDALVSYLKGAPEVIVRRSALDPGEHDSWMGKADAYAREGFRVIAVAYGQGETEEHLTLIGLVLFWDPPRTEVPDAIRVAQDAGIRVVMITGDHPATALAVAHLIGIPGVRVLTGEDLADYDERALADALREVNVFARVRPDQKLRLVEALQAQGEVVAMTGDGVNDAPALKRSDVGIAMGQRGSDVSREVADLVLLDDNFATIVGAVQEGRGIYENIQKFLRFLFSTNMSEVLLVASGAMLSFLLGLREASGALLLPLTAAQILWINLMTDGLPALALAFDRTPGVMQQPPRRPQSPLLDRPAARFVITVGTMKAVLALGLLWLVPRLAYDTDTARAVTFHFMAIGQLLLTYPARHTWIRPLPNGYLHAAVGAGLLIQVVAAFIPVTADLLGQVRLPPDLWGLVLVAALGSWALAESLARLVWRHEVNTRREVSVARAGARDTAPFS